MAPHIVMKPKFKTSSAEVTDLYVQDEYLGTMTLIYRESDRMHGTIQLDDDHVQEPTKDEMITQAQSYIRSLAQALDIENCEVLITHGGCQYVIDEASLINDVQYPSHVRISDPFDEAEFEVVMTESKRQRTKFVIKQTDDDLFAKASVNINQNKMLCTLHFKTTPTHEEIEQMAMLLKEYFHEESIDQLRCKIKVNGKHLETYTFPSLQRLKHQEKHKKQDKTTSKSLKQKKKYLVHLIRDDEDTLTYEIYQDSKNDSFLGTATIDLCRDQLTGYIDFKNYLHEDEREWIASSLLEELDKVKDYQKINLSMFVQNECIDEILFENEQTHR